MSIFGNPENCGFPVDVPLNPQTKNTDVRREPNCLFHEKDVKKISPAETDRPITAAGVCKKK